MRTCAAAHQPFTLPCHEQGVFRYDEKRGVRSAADAAEGLACPGGSCGAALWGAASAAGCFSAISQALILAVSSLCNCV